MGSSGERHEMFRPKWLQHATAKSVAHGLKEKAQNEGVSRRSSLYVHVQMLATGLWYSVSARFEAQYITVI